MKNLLTLILIFVSIIFQGCATTKVFEPIKIQAPQRVGFLEDELIDLAIFDARLNSDYSFELINQISNQIIRTYPSANFNIIPINEFYNNPKSDRITMKISIVSYDAGFGSKVTVITVGTFGGEFGYGIIPEGKWNGVTGFSLNIYDNRNKETKKYSNNIGKIISLPNTYGYKTAKAALDKSYKQTMQDLLMYIDNALMK